MLLREICDDLDVLGVVLPKLQNRIYVIIKIELRVDVLSLVMQLHSKPLSCFILCTNLVQSLFCEALGGALLVVLPPAKEDVINAGNRF